IERDLLGPPRVAGRISRAAVLIDLAEASVGRGARGQPELAAINREIGLGLSIVERVDDRDGLAHAVAGARGGEVVRRLQVGRPVSTRRDGWLWSAGRVDADQRVAARLTRRRARTNSRVQEAHRLARAA